MIENRQKGITNSYWNDKKDVDTRGNKEDGVMVETI